MSDLQNTILESFEWKFGVVQLEMTANGGIVVRGVLFTPFLSSVQPDLQQRGRDTSLEAFCGEKTLLDTVPPLWAVFPTLG
jgi:hypothetical protein